MKFKKKPILLFYIISFAIIIFTVPLNPTANPAAAVSSKQRKDGEGEDEEEIRTNFSSTIRLPYVSLDRHRKGPLFFLFYHVLLEYVFTDWERKFVCYRKQKYQRLYLLELRELLIQLKRRAQPFSIWSVLMLRFCSFALPSFV